ncbi:MAG: sensor histidine kinase [Lachnospiraceae bacterium]
MLHAIPAQRSEWKTAFFVWLGIGGLLFIIFVVTFWVRYYHTVILVAIKIENIKTKYSLIDAEKMTDYSASLNTILDLIDSSLEKEYSSRLLQKQAELDAMQSQINPHFLYNTLDTIRGYAVMEEAPLTSDMVEVLSRLFRYMIGQKNELVTLRQELSTLYDYIKIQEYRINQHIVFMQNIAQDLQIMNYHIPKLIIQPFIENAIKHGIKGITKDFVITLNIHSTQSRLVISIIDNGAGMTAEQLLTLNQKLAQNESNSVHTVFDKKRGSGIALTNVNSRIKLLYGESFGVVAYSTLGKGAEFQISLPFFKNQE